MALSHWDEIRIVRGKAKWVGSLKEVRSRKIQISSQSRAWTFMGVDNNQRNNRNAV